MAVVYSGKFWVIDCLANFFIYFLKKKSLRRTLKAFLRTRDKVTTRVEKKKRQRPRSRNFGQYQGQGAVYYNI